MTDYKEEQNNEVEALESIYPEEFTLLSSEPFHKFNIVVKSSSYLSEDAVEDSSVDRGVCLTLCFQYTERYPDEAPTTEITSPDNIEDYSELESLILDQIAENAGMAMVFTLVSAAQEWLNNYVDGRIQRQQELQERLKLEEEERERKVFEGTRVTVETFMTWKAKFDAEMEALKGTKDSDIENKRKLTGRELFYADKSLNVSDLSFLGEGEGAVAVDESLFEDLDDLDLDDDDDPDYVPDFE